MKLRKLALVYPCLLASLVAAASTGWTHSFPEEQTPSAGQTLSVAPPMVSIKYDAPIEPLFSKLEVVDGAGNSLDADQPQVSSDGFVLSVKLKPLQPGEYTVKWAVVCIDTHHTEGSYTFSVAGGHS